MSCVHFFGIICTMITFLEFFHIVHAVFVYVFILKILNLLSLVIVCLTSLIFLLPVLKILSGKMHVFLKVYISFFCKCFCILMFPLFKVLMFQYS